MQLTEMIPMGCSQRYLRHKRISRYPNQKDKAGKTLIAEREQQERRVEHFKEILPEQSMKLQDERCRNRSTRRQSKVTERLKNNMSPGLDDNPAELMKHRLKDISEEMAKC